MMDKAGYFARLWHDKDAVAVAAASHGSGLGKRGVPCETFLVNE